MLTTISDAARALLFDDLERANKQVSTQFPGDFARRQPVHVVYGGAHLFTAGAIEKLGAIARSTLDRYAPDPETLARALGLDSALASRIYPRIVDKLAREPVEDFRIDFEDGFGNRPDEEEDRFAMSTARHVAAAAKEWRALTINSPLASSAIGKLQRLQ